MARIADPRQIERRAVTFYSLFKPGKDRVVSFLVQSDVARNDLERRVDQRVAAADDVFDQRLVFPGIVVGESWGEEDHGRGGRGARRPKNVNILAVVKRAGEL